VNLWNLRRLGRLDSVRAAVKLLFRLRFQHGRTYRIRRGPLAGMTWVHHRDFQFWMPLGQYEPETAAWLTATIEPGDVVFDIGANAGYFSLVASRAAGAGGRVIAFEPVPTNAEWILRQVRVNGLGNVELAEVALSDKPGKVHFVVETTNANSHLADVKIRHASQRPLERIEVQATTLDEYVRSSGLRPDVLKVDVEGAELLVIEGGAEALRSCRPTCIISTHGPELKRDCRRRMQELGYVVEDLAGFEHELVCRPA
jgi:FkbM family methyltransferase